MLSATQVSRSGSSGKLIQIEEDKAHPISGNERSRFRATILFREDEQKPVNNKLIRYEISPAENQAVVTHLKYESNILIGAMISVRSKSDQTLLMGALVSTNGDLAPFTPEIIQLFNADGEGFTTTDAQTLSKLIEVQWESISKN